jgi:hypothetical protein
MMGERARRRDADVRRVMNPRLLTQNARRHGDQVGFTWESHPREIDGRALALASHPAARHRQGRPYPGPPRIATMFWSIRGLPARRSGADHPG